ncbi:MAG TPA: 5-oxoprolinase subunit PxpB [Chryseosolibacter sp.]
MSEYSIFSLGDQAVSLEITGHEIDPSVHATLMSMKQWLEKNPFTGMQDIVLGYRSISVTFDLFAVTNSGVSNVSAIVKEKLVAAFAVGKNQHTQLPSRHVKIPVCYNEKFGMDIPALCEHNGLSVDEVVELHTNKSYNVYLVGFLPGFPYLGFVDHRLEMPRHPSPRAIVPAGSVGIAGKQTGIYPFDSPGGWQIIGRTPLKMFDPHRMPPVLIEAGDTVTFFSIDEQEFERLQKLP